MPYKYGGVYLLHFHQVIVLDIIYIYSQESVTEAK